MAIREFFKATLKISLAIVIAVVALSLLAWGGLTIYQRSEKLEAEKYEEAKRWQGDVKQYLQMELVAKTKLVDGRMRASVELEGYPAYLSHPRLAAKNRNARLILSFKDKDGFKLFEKELKISDFGTTVNAKGEKIGLSHQFDEYVSLNSYKGFETVAVQWTFDTAIPVEPAPVAKVVPSPKPKAVVDGASDDHCAPGISRAERVRRLAKHGTVRQIGENAYSAEYRRLRFFSDGSLLSCS